MEIVCNRALVNREMKLVGKIASIQKLQGNYKKQSTEHWLKSIGENARQK